MLICENAFSPRTQVRKSMHFSVYLFMVKFNECLSLSCDVEGNAGPSMEVPMCNNSPGLGNMDQGTQLWGIITLLLHGGCVAWYAGQGRRGVIILLLRISRRLHTNDYIGCRESQLLKNLSLLTNQAISIQIASQDTETTTLPKLSVVFLTSFSIFVLEC